VIADSDGIVVDVNTAFSRLVGKEREVLAARSVPGFEPAHSEPQLDDPSSALPERQIGKTVTVLVDTADGEGRALTYSLHHTELAQVPLILMRVVTVGHPRRTHRPVCRASASHTHHRAREGTVPPALTDGDARSVVGDRQAES
jgi:hypothetical protein